MREWYFTEEEYQKVRKEKELEDKYNSAINKLNSAKNEYDLIEAHEIFSSIMYYKDSLYQIEQCKNSLHFMKLNKQYNHALKLVSPDNRNRENIQSAKAVFASLGKFQDSEYMVKKCDEYLKDEVIKEAEKLLKKDTFYSITKAIDKIKILGDYKNALQLIDLANLRLEEIKRNEENQRKRTKKQALLIGLSYIGAIFVTFIVWAALPGCMIHDYDEATCLTPCLCKVCGKEQGEPLGHSWIEATCNKPKTCMLCKKTEGEVAGHKWNEATCESPKTCEVCKITDGVSLGHQWNYETFDNPKMCNVCKKMEPKLTPENGTIIINTELNKTCELTIYNQSSNCLVKMKDINKNDVFAFFVGSNQTVDISVPEGSYYIYFAYGDKWYGKNYLFGDDTTCSMDESIQTFSVTNDGSYITSTHLTYTLYKVVNGNFSPKNIDVSEF